MAKASATTSKKTPAQVIEFCKRNSINIIDLKFPDLPGTMQHFSIPLQEMNEELFEEGTGFDGSSIRGFQHIQESDMLLIPDPETAVVDPVLEIPTLTMICDVKDPVTQGPYSRDPRYIARKAEAYLKKSGLADTSYWGPEAEFFVFDSVRFDYTDHSGFYFVDSAEGIWNSGAENEDGHKNLGYRPRHKEGYFPVPPADMLQDFRSEVILKMLDAGLPIEKHHHEVSTAGQGEIGLRYGTLTRTADNLMMFKYILKNVGRKHGKTVTFMPKPLFGDNGTGMHTHQSLWKNGTNLFYDEAGYAMLSDTALHYIGGLLKHAPALLSICAPTTNSYRRLVPGYEAPVKLAYSARNRSAAVRVPMYFTSPKARRIEFRPPDPSCNPYLAFAAMLMAGIDGVVNKIDPGKPAEKDLYELSAAESAKIKEVPGSLDEVLDALEKDNEFMLRGGVFTKDFISTWLNIKRKECDAVRLRPHPYEYFMYFDA
ncbi:MAG: type I glutamate--ammonia ligase [Dehalococcoidia bacterium]|nr:type I glutamate--ammonia ligase [Dehalococcoidia bacterium]